MAALPVGGRTGGHHPHGAGDINFPDYYDNDLIDPPALNPRILK